VCVHEFECSQEFPAKFQNQIIVAPASPAVMAVAVVARSA
jgi:hypothetical protein